eukprot:1722480-Rhodomonas_salina.1
MLSEELVPIRKEDAAGRQVLALGQHIPLGRMDAWERADEVCGAGHDVAVEFNVAPRAQFLALETEEDQPPAAGVVGLERRNQVHLLQHRHQRTPLLLPSPCPLVQLHQQRFGHLRTLLQRLRPLPHRLLLCPLQCAEVRHKLFVAVLFLLVRHAIESRDGAVAGEGPGEVHEEPHVGHQRVAVHLPLAQRREKLHRLPRLLRTQPLPLLLSEIQHPQHLRLAQHGLALLDRLLDFEPAHWHALAHERKLGHLLDQPRSQLQDVALHA